MAARRSAGLLLFRVAPDGTIEALIAHMGGPFWERKDDGAWSIPKGELREGEDPLTAARREFTEELGLAPPDGTPIHLGVLRQSAGKEVEIWAQRGDLDVSEIHGNLFELEWPPKSGEIRRYPEIDRAAWFDLQTASRKLLRGQVRFLQLLKRFLTAGDGQNAAENT